jgi:hypothetical protein
LIDVATGEVVVKIDLSTPIDGAFDGSPNFKTVETVDVPALETTSKASAPTFTGGYSESGQGGSTFSGTFEMTPGSGTSEAGTEGDAPAEDANDESIDIPYGLPYSLDTLEGGISDDPGFLLDDFTGASSDDIVIGGNGEDILFGDGPGLSDTINGWYGIDDGIEAGDSTGKENGPLVGDENGDGRVDFADLTPFVKALTDDTASYATNGDDIVTNTNSFVGGFSESGEGGTTFSGRFELSPGSDDRVSGEGDDLIDGGATDGLLTGSPSLESGSGFHFEYDTNGNLTASTATSAETEEFLTLTSFDEDDVLIGGGLDLFQ